MRTFRIKNLVILVLAAMVSRVPQLHAAEVAEGRMISTTEWVNQQERERLTENVRTFLSRADIREQLAKSGHSAQEMELRLASLSDVELKNLSSELDGAKYGGDGVIAILVIVVLVLLIIYLAKRV